MPILYTVVSRGLTVLARHASCSGNFQEITCQVLSQISPNEPKMTFSHDSYLFHYVCDDGITYMCFTDDEFERSRAFMFLHEIQQRFRTMYGARAQSAIAYAMNGEFGPILRSQMALYSDGKNLDPIARVHGDLDDLKDIMVKNIDNVAMRGEKLELLINKAENLSNASVNFRQTSRVLERALFWKLVKYYVLVAAIVIVVLYLIVSMFCGGLSWSSCVA